MVEDPQLTDHFMQRVRESDANGRNGRILCNSHLATYASPASGLRPDRLEMLKDLQNYELAGLRIRLGW